MRYEKIYLTAEQLQIPQITRAGLERLADELESGTLPHDPDGEILRSDPRFNMATWGRGTPSCGTAMCIGGHLEARGELPLPLSEMPEELVDLFHPRSVPRGHWCRITPLQAARAVRLYLSSGRERWVEAAPELAVTP